nr:MAG TPA: hypothetical protein [Caudoviricetes sp.]
MVGLCLQVLPVVGRVAQMPRAQVVVNVNK